MLRMGPTSCPNGKTVELYPSLIFPVNINLGLLPLAAHRLSLLDCNGLADSFTNDDRRHHHDHET
jgi:hypothetical protein